MTPSTADALDMMNRLAERTRQLEQANAKLADVSGRLGAIRDYFKFMPDEPQAIGKTEAEFIASLRESLVLQRNQARDDAAAFREDNCRMQQLMNQDAETMRKLRQEFDALKAESDERARADKVEIDSLRRYLKTAQDDRDANLRNLVARKEVVDNLRQTVEGLRKSNISPSVHQQVLDERNEFQRKASDLEHANLILTQQVEELQRENDDWVFVSDEFGGHMLCRSAKQKWYPLEYFKRPDDVQTPLNRWNGVDASGNVPGWIEKIRLWADDGKPGVYFIWSGDSMAMCSSYSGRKEFFHLKVVGIRDEAF